MPFERVAKFIRQLTHDVRNSLSAVDLESAFIAELVTDPEAADEVRKLRAMVSNAAKILRDLSQNFQPVTVELMPWQAAIIFEELSSRLPKQFPEDAATVDLECRIKGEMIQVDLEQFIRALCNVLLNAFQFRQEGVRTSLACFAEGGFVVFEVREPKRTFESPLPVEEWGSEPLFSTRPGGYGLGLYRARQVLEAHGGQLQIKREGDSLLTRVVLPIYKENPDSEAS